MCACGVGAAPQAGPAPGIQRPLAGVRVTEKHDVACGPDYIERHATSVADLDGNGRLDRPSVARAADGIVVKLHELPSFAVAGSWKLEPANGDVEIATPRRRDAKVGDLWIMVAAERKPQAWTTTLYHLEGGSLVAVSSSYTGFSIRVDVDGDGRVDPLGTWNDQKQGGTRALLASGAWIDVPAVLPSQVHGMRTNDEQETAIDLDGNGVRELVIEHANAVAIVETPTMREVWRARGKPWSPRLMTWGGSTVLAVGLDEKLKIFATDRTHALIAEIAEAESYSKVPATLGARLVVTGVPWHIYDRADPARAIATPAPLISRLDDRVAPFGPVRLLASDPPSFVTIGGSAEPVDLRLVAPQTFALGRTAWRSRLADSRLEADVTAALVDLDRDGTSEVLLEDVRRTAFHHGASWNTMQMRIVDGNGTVLWEEPRARTDHWIHADGRRGAMRQDQIDGTHVRAFDLGDGTTPLRVRSVRDEYYILAAASKLATIPICLE